MVGEVRNGVRVLHVAAPLPLVGDFNMVVRLLKVVEGRLGGRVSGEDMDGKRNLPGLWVGGDIGVLEDVDNDLVWVVLGRVCGGALVLGDSIVLS